MHTGETDGAMNLVLDSARDRSNSISELVIQIYGGQLIQSITLYKEQSKNYIYVHNTVYIRFPLPQQSYIA